MAIQFLRGTSSQRSTSSATLLAGQPFYETDSGDIIIHSTDTVVSTAPTKRLRAKLDLADYCTLRLTDYNLSYLYTQLVSSWSSLNVTSTALEEELPHFQVGDQLRIRGSADSIADCMMVTLKYVEDPYYYFEGNYKEISLQFKIAVIDDELEVYYASNCGSRNIMMDNAGGLNLPYHTVVSNNKLYLSDNLTAWEPLYRHNMTFTGYSTGSASLWAKITWYSTASDAVSSSLAATFLKALAGSSVGVSSSMYPITGILSAGSTSAITASAVYPIVGITKLSSGSSYYGFVYLDGTTAKEIASSSWTLSDSVSLVSRNGF